MMSVSKARRLSCLFVVILVLVFCVGKQELSWSAVAQDSQSAGSDDQSRKMIVEEYRNKRKSSRKGGTRVPIPYRSKAITAIPPGYSRKSDQGNSKSSPSHRARSKKPLVMVAKAPIVRTGQRPTGARMDGRTIGITFWRLRPSKAGDTSRIITQRTEEGGQHGWTPERIEAETLLADGDRLRMSIESPDEGYLYVINSEYFADQTVGAPFMIFPTTKLRGGDNYIEAGQIVDIPAESDPQPWFRVELSNKDHVAELLTIIVSKTPLDLPVERNDLKLDWNLVFGWIDSWGATVERLEQVGSVGRGRTSAEKEAAASDSRSITQDDPMPQTIYHVATKPGDPLILTVPLLYKNFAGRR